MSTSDPRSAPPVLPPRARVLHIGVPKSGTTTVQRAAAARRRELLAHGVRYPGREVNHRNQVAALMGRRLGWAGEDERRPGIAAWRRLMREIDADRERRILLSHEFVSECTDAQAARFAAELGERLHVVVTLRGYPSILASAWQQYVRSSVRRSLEQWLRDVLADPPGRALSPKMTRRQDHGRLVARWVEILGPDRVVVVIADRADHDHLTDAFADLLGLPRAVLRAPAGDGFAVNRSLSLPEVELVRAVNRRLRGRGATNSLSWPQYARLVRGGAVARLQAVRTPGPDEPRVVLPEWAAQLAYARARADAAAIAAGGARVIGDLADLYAPVPTCRAVPAVTAIPTAAAAEALAGMALAAGNAGPLGESGRRSAWQAAHHATAGVPTSHLLAVAAVREARRARRLLSGSRGRPAARR